MATGAGRLTAIAAVAGAARNAQASPLTENGEARVFEKGGANSEANSEETIGTTIEARTEVKSAVTGEPRNGARAEVTAMLPIIEVSDEDYRSFCFPCHALEDADDCNDGY